MATIKTLDTLDDYSKFPALKHFFKCDEGAGLTNLTDSVAGVVTGAFDTITQTAGLEGLAVDGGQTNNTAIASGTLAAPGTKSAIMFSVADFGSFSTILNLGTQTTIGGVQYNGAALTAGWGDGSANIVSTVSVLAAVSAHAIVYVPSSYVTTYSYVAAGTFSENNAGRNVVGIPEEIPSVNQATTFGIDGVGPISSFYGMAVFHFDNLPDEDEINEAMRWMYDSWLLGNKYIYPNWQGVQ